jgi:hypothetical protein
LRTVLPPVVARSPLSCCLANRPAPAPNPVVLSPISRPPSWKENQHIQGRFVWFQGGGWSAAAMGDSRRTAMNMRAICGRGLQRGERGGLQRCGRQESRRTTERRAGRGCHGWRWIAERSAERGGLQRGERGAAAMNMRVICGRGQSCHGWSAKITCSTTSIPTLLLSSTFSTAAAHL